MDPQTQALIVQLMGGQNNVQPSMIQQQTNPQQFGAQQLGYGSPAPGMFQQPQGAQAQMSAYPQMGM